MITGTKPEYKFEKKIKNRNLWMKKNLVPAQNSEIYLFDL